ncbi:MAG: hypothetical protein Q9159_001128 [Coniocarpon cinnabarinum]
MVRILGREVEDEGVSSLRFAIRSGGHAPDAESANVVGGITIDLCQLKQIEILNDNLVSIGTAARWIEVYEALEKSNLGVCGGRAGNVGVGGLTLGGGISFFSPRHGFVCDGVVEYEVVLADGNVVRATENCYADLWRALKGGGNNFGIVTKFIARTYAQERLWAGYMYHSVSAAPQLLQAFHDFSIPEHFDEYATAWLAMGYSSKWRSTAMASHIVYTKPEKRPAALEKFMTARRFWSTVKLRSMASTGREMDSNTPPGFRGLFKTTTFENDIDMLTYAFEAYQESVQQMKSVKGLTWTLVVQALHPVTTSRNRANVLGIETDKSLTIVLITASWKREHDDKTIHKIAEDLLASIEARSRALGLSHPYIYMNYAGNGQDPIASYGARNKSMLQDTSRKYDPRGVFQRACVGGFKVF